ncbi:MAG: NAD-dependent epimerase/dehydratase family protein [Bacilli bacterium]|nr:NAD-dependent epimerase/dehydratase family protein [Bacilli bacterium]
MNVLVTGAKGFIGKHMCQTLKRNGHDVFEYDLGSSEDELISYIKQSNFIVHLAGVNRPLNKEEFYDGNVNFTIKLVELIKKYNDKIVIISNSSTQASLDNDYGKSKKQMEDYLLSCGIKVFVYRFSNVFGKWCRPNYNSASATFCYNIAHNLDIEVRDPNYVVHYNYVDDICDEILNVILGKSNQKPYQIGYISPLYDCSLGHLADLLYYFKKCVESDTHLPLLHNEFEVKLFITFLDYLSDEGSTYNYATDARGSFEELYKSKKFGQISMNMSYPGITKGGHYHTYKKEIFYTVKGQCEIKQRNIKNNKMLVNNVSGNNPQPVDIIPYYTHSITNTGNENSYTIMWISEIYKPETHDTYKEDL